MTTRPRPRRFRPLDSGDPTQDTARVLEEERARRESNPSTSTPTPSVESPSVNPFDLIADLSLKDAAFVRRYLETADLSAACNAAGYSTDSLIGPRKLADPAIARVIGLCAAFVTDSKRAMKICAPYMLHRLLQVAITGRDAQAVGAIRDALVIAGEGRDADSKDVAGLVRAMRAERDRMRMGKGTTPPPTDGVTTAITKRDKDGA